MTKRTGCLLWILALVMDPDMQPFFPEGETWNPVIGTNRMADGEGLNPRKTAQPTEDASPPSSNDADGRSVTDEDRDNVCDKV